MKQKKQKKITVNGIDFEWIVNDENFLMIWFNKHILREIKIPYDIKEITSTYIEDVIVKEIFTQKR